MNDASADPAPYEWHPRSILFPRIGKMVTRDGVRTRLILPGRYLVRRSRSMNRWVYRRDGP